MHSNRDEREIDSALRKMNKVFIKAFCNGDTFVVENTIRKHENSASLWDGP